MQYCYELLFRHASDSTDNLVRTQATGAGVNVAGGTVYNSLNPLNIGLPGAVAPPMGMGYLNTKGNAFAADVAFCHTLHLLLQISRR